MNVESDSIRLNVKIFRDEQPLLFRELQNVAKGPRRVSRLVQLAAMAVLLEQMIPAGEFRKGHLPTLGNGNSSRHENPEEEYEAKLATKDLLSLLSLGDDDES